MSSPHLVAFCFRRVVLLPVVVLASSLMSGTAHAQQQESALMNRIMHPNMDLHYDGFDKAFDGKAAAGNRKATVHSFAFGHAAAMKTGDGAFHARHFTSEKSGFRTEGYATKTAPTADRKAVSQADRTFDTRSVEAQEDRAAGKTSTGIRQYVSAEKPYLVPGKRQDDMDDLRKQKNLTIDQVREILNKSK